MEKIIKIIGVPMAFGQHDRGADLTVSALGKRIY